jgi:gliding motility-associated-like protein
MQIKFTLFHPLVLLALVLCISLSTRAQLCNGSLGDPVVNINFGAGGFSTAVPSNSYVYTSSSCPNDGFYTITNRTANCFNNSWITVNSDHTGGGAFMLVNASITPGDFFVSTVTDLCPNTTYEFAAWLMNVMGRAGIKPNVTFTIETPGGAILQQYNTGDIPENFTPTWKQYGFFFSTPVNNPVIVLRMRNNAPGGIGNDIALDDITFRPCGNAVLTNVIQGNADTVHVCEGNTNLYTFNSSISAGYVMPVYQWQVKKDTATLWQDIANANALKYVRQPTSPGNYLYRLTVTEQSAVNFTACRIPSNVVRVDVHANPIVNAGPDKIIFAKDSALLDGSIITENPVYYWQPAVYLNSSLVLKPMSSPPVDIGYTLFATSQYGCSASDNVQVKVVAGIYVPNVFTPNKDGKNDNWRIPFLDPLLGAEVNVFNRFGQLVYTVNGKTVDWNGNYKGQPQPGGNYVYTIRFKKTSGEVNMKGIVLLIR